MTEAESSCGVACHNSSKVRETWRSGQSSPSYTVLWEVHETILALISVMPPRPELRGASDASKHTVAKLLPTIPSVLPLPWAPG